MTAFNGCFDLKACDIHELSNIAGQSPLYRIIIAF
jgi:hypothetical protein